MNSSQSIRLRPLLLALKAATDVRIDTAGGYEFEFSHTNGIQGELWLAEIMAPVSEFWTLSERRYDSIHRSRFAEACGLTEVMYPHMNRKYCSVLGLKLNPPLRVFNGRTVSQHGTVLLKLVTP